MTRPTPIDDAPRLQPPLSSTAMNPRPAHNSCLLASILVIAFIGMYPSPQQTGDDKSPLTNFPLTLGNTHVRIDNPALGSNQIATASPTNVPPPPPTNIFAIGSAPYAAATAIDTNLTLPAVMAIYSTMNHSATNYTRNSSCWAHAFDLTCVPAYNSYEQISISNCCANPSYNCCVPVVPTKRAGTLISPRHIIFANHYWIANGSTLRFVAMDNTVVSRVLSNSIQVSTPIRSIDALGHTNTSSKSTDLQVGLLDSDVPTNLITFARVLPANYTNYFPNLSNRTAPAAIPALCLDQNANAEVVDVSCIFTSSAEIGEIVFSHPQDATEQQFYGDGRKVGDSGQPVFLVINGQLVIVTVWSSAFAGGAGNFIYDADSINAAMTTLGGGYKLTPIDLSGFTRY